MEEWNAWYNLKQEWVEWSKEGRKEILGEKGEEGEYTVQEVEAEVPIGGPTEEVLKN